MKLFNKTSLKFFGGFAAIVVGSIAIAFIAVYFSPESRQERAAVDQDAQEEELVSGENQQ
jgi:hypothetical protein